MYYVEKIIGRKEEKGKIKYKVKWEGWDIKEATWVIYL
jgi:hypothetical protein